MVSAIRIWPISVEQRLENLCPIAEIFMVILGLSANAAAVHDLIAI
jgi:hypothetical protein